MNSINFTCFSCGFTHENEHLVCPLCRTHVKDNSGAHIPIDFVHEPEEIPVEISHIGKSCTVTTVRGPKEKDVFSSKIIGETSTHWKLKHPEAEELSLLVPKLACKNVSVSVKH